MYLFHRKLQKQHKQLSTWITDEEGTVSEVEILEVKAEVQEVCMLTITVFSSIPKFDVNYRLIP